MTAQLCGKKVPFECGLDHSTSRGVLFSVLNTLELQQQLVSKRWNAGKKQRGEIESLL